MSNGVKIKKSTATVIIIIGILASLLFLIVSSTSANEEPLTNETITTLVKAGLSDAAIVSLIQRSRTKFDLTPEAIVNLKQAGVSNTIIEVMIGVGKVSSNHGVQTTGSSEVQPLPTAYGIYAVDENQIYELKPAQVTTKMGLIVGGSSDRGMAVDGLSGEPSLNFKKPNFIAYKQNVDVNTIHLSKLEYTSTMKAYEFNILNTNPNFFYNIYRRNYYDEIPVNLWRPRGDMRFRIEPIPSKPDMYRLIPELTLTPGRYALYFEKTIHQSDIVFTVSPGRQASAFYFGIGENLESKATKTIYENKTEGKDSKVRQITGEVIAIDTAIKTITVKGKNKEVTFSCANDTGFREAHNFRDIKVGDKVVVRYVEYENKNIAKNKEDND